LEEGAMIEKKIKTLIGKCKKRDGGGALTIFQYRTNPPPGRFSNNFLECYK
jgi:hypothetical protein